MPSVKTRFIKILISNYDCKGLYYKDISNLYKDKKELSKKDLEKINYNNSTFEIRLYPKWGGIKKKAFKVSDITGLNALKLAISKRNELIEELNTTGIIKKENTNTLNDIFERYIDFKQSTLSKENIYSMNKTYDKWIRNNIGKMLITHITFELIQPIINKMLKQGLAPRTAKTIKQILSPVFNYAIDLNICTINQASKLTIPKFDNTKSFHLDEDKRLKLLDEILKYEHDNFKGIMIFLYLGRRLNEVLTLKWDKIKFNQQMDTYIIDAKYSKARVAQEYPLPNIAKDFLINYGLKNTGFIFPGTRVEHIVRSTFIRHWKIVLKRADLNDMGIHDTRHLIGSTLINKGVSEDIIAKLLGHKSFTVTSRYATVNINSINEALNIYLEN